MVGSVYLGVLYPEHSVYFRNKSVRVLLEVLHEEGKLLQKVVKLHPGDGLEDVLLVLGEEEEFPAPPPSCVLPVFIELVFVLKQIETGVNTRKQVLRDEVLEHKRSVDGELALDEGESRKNEGFLLIVYFPLLID